MYSSFQKAKIEAINNNAQHAVVFNPAANTYQILSDWGPDGVWGTADDTNPHPGLNGAYGDDDDIPESPAVNLSTYRQGVAFGNGTATTNATTGGGAFPADFVSYNNNMVIFSASGMLSGVGTGYVYLTNANGTAYALGTPTITANIRLVRWHDANNAWRDWND